MTELLRTRSVGHLAVKADVSEDRAVRHRARASAGRPQRWSAHPLALVGERWPTRRRWASPGEVALWVEMFRAAGFVSDTGEPKPALPWTVYRGTVWGRRRGMSWTTDLERARWFAARYAVRHRDGLVFAVDVAPSAVLALVGDPGGRNESEVVVDLALLPTIGRRSVVSDS